MQALPPEKNRRKRDRAVEPQHHNSVVLRSGPEKSISCKTVDSRNDTERDWCSGDAGWDGPIARVTTCLCDHSLAEDEAYVDTNNCPWAVALLEENGFAERTGRTRRSGYCEYPAMKFDRSKMAEFEEES